MLLQLMRIFFTKTAETAYISHLDLQRVMARALRKSGMPVWYSKGFNPHIYMSFSLPLPLMVESVCESVDVKTESEEDLSVYAAALTQALPRGIQVTKIAQPMHKADDIAFADYEIAYPEISREELEKVVEKYTQMPTAMVTHKTKRSEKQVDLKQVLPRLELLPTVSGLQVRLPAGQTVNYSPNLLTAFLQSALELPAEKARVLRKGVFLQNGEPFC